MKDFQRYLPLIIISALIIYFFYPYLIAIAIVLLIVCFHKEFLGLCALAQIIAIVIGIPYLFFTDSQSRKVILTLILLLGGLFLLGYLSERNNKSKQNNKADSSHIKPEQVPRLEKNTQTINVQSHYNENSVRNNNISRRKNVCQTFESSRSYDLAYWQGNKNYPYTYFHSGYWEYVDLKSCEIIRKSLEECYFVTKFIGAMNNVPPKIIKTGKTMFRQRKSNNNLPEFYDDEKKVWITLPKYREHLSIEGNAQYINAVLPFKNNMFRIVYRQLFKCDYIDPR